MYFEEIFQDLESVNLIVIFFFSRPKIEKYFHTEGKMKDNIKWDVKMKPIATFVCKVRYLYNERVI